MRPQLAARSNTTGDGFGPVAIPFQEYVPTSDPHQAALAVIGQVCAMLGHELRSPVGAALMHAGLVDMQHRSGVDPVGLRQAETAIKQEIVRLGSLIARLTRDVAPEGWERVLHREEVDLRKLIPGVIAELTAGDPPLRKRGQTRFDGDPTGCWDAAALEEVLANLLGNAIKFGEDRPILVSAHNDSPLIRIMVQDHGIGISTRDHRRIFERFQRAVPPRSYAGLGLGLWAVRQLVNAHGGSVHVFSVLGCGSLFKVTLPRE